MSGLDEVEEWLRERSYLLQTLQQATEEVVREYMKLPGRSLTDECPAVGALLDAYIAILEYKRQKTTAGIWLLFEGAEIPAQLIPRTKDIRYARRCLSHLLNTQVAAPAAVTRSGCAASSPRSRTASSPPISGIPQSCSSPRT